MKHAWFSEQASKRFGYALYETEDGRTQIVTFVADELEGGAGYQWSDKVYVGQVTEMVSSHRGAREATPFLQPLEMIPDPLLEQRLLLYRLRL